MCRSGVDDVLHGMRLSFFFAPGTPCAAMKRNMPKREDGEDLIQMNKKGKGLGQADRREGDRLEAGQGAGHEGAQNYGVVNAEWLEPPSGDSLLRVQMLASHVCPVVCFGCVLRGWRFLNQVHAGSRARIPQGQPDDDQAAPQEAERPDCGDHGQAKDEAEWADQEWWSGHTWKEENEDDSWSRSWKTEPEPTDKGAEWRMTNKTQFELFSHGQPCVLRRSFTTTD